MAEYTALVTAYNQEHNLVDQAAHDAAVQSTLDFGPTLRILEFYRVADTIVLPGDQNPLRDLKLRSERAFASDNAINRVFTI